MRALASSFGAWRSIEKSEGTKAHHGLVFSLAVVAAIGKPHGLELVAEEDCNDRSGFDAVFVSVLDSRCMIPAVSHFSSWGLPFRRSDRTLGKYPLVWMGGQGLHNPMPMYDVADLIVVGDAEDPLPILLQLWERHGNTDGFLVAASTVPGVLVPSCHHPSEATIVQSVSRDIGITLREHVDVSHNGTRRIEIARGCRFKCAFCSLGWRAPVRENSPACVISAIGGSRASVHLQAGDSESHSGIDEIREALSQSGVSDRGWTGRLDTVSKGRATPGQKRYAFGVEGTSYRLRRAVGKWRLTDEALIQGTVEFLRTIEGDSKGRSAWHLIAGLPTESLRDIAELGSVLSCIDRMMQGATPRNLSIHWQPFQPLPGTPMQWFGGGTGARKHASILKPYESLSWLKIRQHGGRTDDIALVCSSLARADRRGVALIEAVASRRVSPSEAEEISGSTFGDIDPDSPLPWDFISHAYSRETLRKAYRVIVKNLTLDHSALP